jgi:hypothetical protein
MIWKSSGESRSKITTIHIADPHGSGDVARLDQALYQATFTRDSNDSGLVAAPISEDAFGGPAGLAAASPTGCP